MPYSATQCYLQLLKDSEVLTEFDRLLGALLAGQYQKYFSKVPVQLTATEEEAISALQKISGQLRGLVEQVRQIELEITHLSEQWQSTASGSSTAFFYPVPTDGWYVEMTASLNHLRHDLEDHQHTADSLTKSLEEQLHLANQPCLLKRAKKMGSLLGRIQLWIEDLLDHIARKSNPLKTTDPIAEKSVFSVG